MAASNEKERLKEAERPAKLSENQEKLNTLSRDVLVLSRNTLLVNLRFLDAALSRFVLVRIPEGTLATDGRHLYFEPLYILNRYREEKEIPVRDYLHVLLHCILMHLGGTEDVERELWDLACDIAVEHIIAEINISAARAHREIRQKDVYETLTEAGCHFTAEKLYRFFLKEKLPESTIRSWQELFRADDHTLWYLANGDSAGQEEADGKSRNPNQGNSPDAEDPEEIWKEIARRMEMELESFAKGQGEKAGNFLQNLKEVNRETYDYTSFLKKFAVIGELMQINDDEFDYNYYTYGLKLYENMPLIEPLEYKEAKRVREFVIAIDTSGSVAGDEVQAFVQKTYNILKSTESFFSKINLHIIQCDADIQEHVKITCQEEFDAYMENMQIHGLGGTDFRPVFREVDRLIQEKEFTNLKGLIYFTDGFGTFPKRKPNYDAAFVYVNDLAENPVVPPWAIKLVLRREDLKNPHK